MERPATALSHPAERILTESCSKAAPAGSGADLFPLPGYKPTHPRIFDLMAGVDKLTLEYTWEIDRVYLHPSIHSPIQPSIPPPIHLPPIYVAIHSSTHLNIQADNPSTNILRVPTVCLKLC